MGDRDSRRQDVPQPLDGTEAGPEAPAADLAQSSVTIRSGRPGQPPGGNGQLPEPGTVIAGKYRIEQLLAQGGMGAVYAATHVVSDKRVALKWMLPALNLYPDASERFIREARATARIDHPNVVDIYDVGSDNGSVYLVMEFLRGETLHERLERGPLSPRNTVALIMPALRGVAAAHAQGVIHRDLKPDNIFLCQSTDGEPRDPKVLDFGISKFSVADKLRDPALTHSGMVMGTPYYMSPEQARGANQVDARTDVYAFGVILYEMLTRRRPFEAETYNQLIFKIATEDPEPIDALNPEVSDELIEVVERAMARDPAQRFQTIEALGAALEPHASGGVTFRLSSSIPGEPGAAAAYMPPGRAPVRTLIEDDAGTTRLPSLAVLGAAAIALVLLGVLIWRFTQGAEVAREPVPVPQRAAEIAPAAAATVAMPSAQPSPAEQARPAPLPSGVEPPVEVAADVAAAPAAQAPATNAPTSRTGSSSRSKRKAAAAAAAAAANNGKLADDWDERLRVAPTGEAAPSAGRIDDSDLR